MKFLLVTAIAVLLAQGAIAYPKVNSNIESEALTQLEIARSEIDSVLSLIPKPLKKIIGKNLENASKRIAFAYNTFSNRPTSSGYYCVVNSTFDGQFSGTGLTQLEATAIALNACRLNSKSNGFFCDKPDKVACQVQ